jgi:mycothiol synthase
MASPIETKELVLPKGYRVRPTTMDDAEASVKLWEAVSSHMGVPEILEADDERQEWSEPNFNLGESSIVVQDEQGNVVGMATLYDNSQVPVRSYLNWNVHPAHEGKGLEQYLLQWLEQTAQRVIDRCPPNTQVCLSSGTLSTYQPRIKIFEAAGYTHVRNFHRMKVSLSEAPAEPSIAEGFSIRPMNYPEEFEAGVIARTSAFRDHWGWVDEPIENEIKFWQHYVDNDKLFDPSLYFLAIENATGKIAGLVWGRMEEHGEAAHAYVAQVAVVKEYRKKGLAEALLLHCFGEFWRRGKTVITLYVDASSLTGATRLYEKVGMRPDRTWASYQKIIREGIDLVTRSVKSED